MKKRDLLHNYGILVNQSFTLKKCGVKMTQIFTLLCSSCTKKILFSTFIGLGGQLVAHRFNHDIFGGQQVAHPTMICEINT